MMTAVLWTIICVTAMICGTILWAKGPDFEIEFCDHSKDKEGRDNV